MWGQKSLNFTCVGMTILAIIPAMLYIQSGRMIPFRNPKTLFGITVQQVIDWDFGY
jgi:hypothetical protein